MNPWVVAAAWPLACVGAAALAARLQRPWIAALGPAFAAAVTPLITASVWLGPVRADAGADVLTPARDSIGLLVVAGISLAAVHVLAARVEARALILTGLVGGAGVVLVGESVPVVWGLAAAFAVSAISVRWIMGTPGPSTLATGRIAGSGAAALMAAATFVPSLGESAGTRTVLAGVLLAVGIGALIALVPLGGWAASAAGVVRGADLAPWALLLAPVLLVSAWSIGLTAAPPSRPPFSDTLLILGLVSGAWGGLSALRASPMCRYGRVVIADVALAAAGIGTGHDMAYRGALLIVLTHLAIGPILLHAVRPGLERPHRLAWLALAGVPPAPAFWARLLVLEGLAATSGRALACGVLAATLLTGAAVRSAVVAERAPAGARRASPGARMLAWTLCVVALAAGCFPGAAAQHVFGLHG